jgi:arginine-tRNA-protein transferase
MIADAVGDGFSAVYSFFTPAEPRRSLGTTLILSLIDEALDRHKPFVYLGYWIAKTRKMAYKSRFQPLQFLGPNGWN